MIKRLILAAAVGFLVGAYEYRRKIPYVPEHLLN